MKRILLLFLVLLGSRSSFAQIDTIVIGMHGGGMIYEELIDAIHSGKKHYLVLDPGLFTNITPCDKRCTRIRKEAMSLLDKKWGEIKVLYIENPTVFSIEDSSKASYDKKSCVIYQLPFEKMKSLVELNLIGNDADAILEMPDNFFSSSAKAINCYCLWHFYSLKKNVETKKKNILIQKGDCGNIWDKMDKLFRY